MRILLLSVSLFGCGNVDPAPLETAGDPKPEATWSYERLTDGERAVVDRGRDVRAWKRVHAEFAAAVAAQARRAR